MAHGIKFRGANFYNFSKLDMSRCQVFLPPYNYSVPDISWTTVVQVCLIHV